MAVTITVTELAQAIRVADATPGEPVTAILQRNLDTATLLVEGAAGSAPDAVHNQSVVMVVATLFDNPNSRNPLADSGAQSILSPYRVPVSRAV